jgi:hypothetical protein
MGLTPMGDRYRRPDWVRRVNAMGPATGGPGRLVPLEAGELIDHARASTGIADAGDLGDGDWEGRLRALVDAVNGSELHVVGRLMTREEMLRCLQSSGTCPPSHSAGWPPSVPTASCRQIPWGSASAPTAPS